MKTFALYNLKGGVGKTSSAVTFAWLSAEEGMRTLLWDLDPQGAATYTFRMRPRVDGGARGLLRGKGALRSSIRASDFEGLDILPSDFTYRELDLLLGDEPGRETIAGWLEPLSAEYDRILIDCAPGLSLVSEHVFRAADALLVPTVPTVLSLRTLARLLKHVKTRPREERPRVVPFFSMADRRKSLHRRVMDYAETEGLGFTTAAVPYASVVEQIGTRRLPLHAFAGSTASAAAYADVWGELMGRLEGAMASDPDPKRRAVKSLLKDAEATAGPARRRLSRRSKLVPRPEPMDALDLVDEQPGAQPPRADKVEEAAMEEPMESPDPEEAVGDGPDGVEREFKLTLASGREADRIVSELVPSGPVPARSVAQVNHFFDDAEGRLRAGAMALRLREQGSDYFLTAKGPHGASDATSGLTSKREVEARVSADEAAEVLAEERSPLELLARSVAGSTTADRDGRFLDAMRARLGGKLLRVGTFRNERRRIGPVHLAGTPESLGLVFEIDRTEFPGGHVHHELELEVAASDAQACGQALRALFDRIGLPWRPARSKAARLFEILEASS